MPSDLGAVGTAMSVMGSYNFSLSPEALYTLIYFLFFIFWGFRIGIRMGKWVHILVSVMAVLFVGMVLYGDEYTESSGKGIYGTLLECGRYPEPERGLPELFPAAEGQQGGCSRRVFRKSPAGNRGGSGGRL